LGNAPAHKLFDRVKVSRQVDGAPRALGDRGYDNYPPARAFKDYLIEIDEIDLPEGVAIIERV
jgi:CRISPR-associated protein Csd2